MALDIDPIQAVRLLIADVSTDPAKQLLADYQIEQYLSLAGDNVRRGAAECLDAIAVSEVLVSKKIRTQDLTTDGPAVAAELRARARQLRDQADEDDDREWGGFDIIDTPTARRPEYTNPQAWGL